MNYSTFSEWFFYEIVILKTDRLLTLSFSAGRVKCANSMKITEWGKTERGNAMKQSVHASWKQFTTRSTLFECDLMWREIVMAFFHRKNLKKIANSKCFNSPLNDPMYRFPMMCHNSGSPVFRAMIKCCLQGETSKCVMRPPGTVMQRICDGSGTGSQPVSGTSCQKSFAILAKNFQRKNFTLKKSLSYQWNRVAVTPCDRGANCDAEQWILAFVGRHRPEPWNQLQGVRNTQHV